MTKSSLISNIICCKFLDRFLADVKFESKALSFNIIDFLSSSSVEHQFLVSPFWNFAGRYESEVHPIYDYSMTVLGECKAKITPLLT